MIGENIRSIIRANNKSKVVTLDTKLKLSLKTRGVKVEVLYKSNNLVNEFKLLLVLLSTLILVIEL
jgi:rRNA-processing protein FCF1